MLDVRLKISDCRMCGVKIARFRSRNHVVALQSKICNLQSEISSDCVFAATHLNIDQSKVRAFAVVGGFDGNDALVLLGADF